MNCDIALKRKDMIHMNNKAVIGDIVKSIEKKYLLPKDEYFVVIGTRTENSITYYVLESLGTYDKLQNIFRFDLFKVITENDVEDIERIISQGAKLDNEYHKECITKLIEKVEISFFNRIKNEIDNGVFGLPSINIQTTFSQDLQHVLNLAVENTSEEEVMNTLMKLLPLSEIRLGVKYKHIITGKKYYLVQDPYHKSYLDRLTHYRIVDNDTHQIVNKSPEETATMQRLIRDMGLQMDCDTDEL